MASPTPRGLSTRAKKVYRSVADRFEMRDDELDVLYQYCVQLDITARLEAEIGPETELLVPAQRGGVQAHPLLAEIRLSRVAASALWKSLRLPLPEAGSEVRAPEPTQLRVVENQWMRRVEA